MELSDARIAYLLEAYTAQTASLSEEQELMDWILAAEEDSALKLHMQKLWDQYQPGEPFSKVDWDGMFSGIVKEEKLPVISKRKKMDTWLRIAAAAAVLLVISTVVWFVPKNNSVGKPPVAVHEAEQTDRSPGHDGAVLTLADGRQLILDSLGNGKIATENGNDVILDKGQLKYVLSAGSTGEVAYNTMNTPKGRQFKLTLPDGTIVWLNSASSIRYPTVFTGKDRKVTVTGEAYFDIAKKQQQPFVVNVNDKMEVQVLGTVFNINAYQDQGQVKTTLLEGSVRVHTNNEQQLMMPGQQTKVNSDGTIKLVEKADLDQVVAWKNGLFNFNNEDLRSVMEEIGRWYDVQIVYESDPPQREIMGEMQRNLSLAQVMNVLKKLHINYRLEEKKLIITK